MGRMRLSTLRFHHARALAVTALVVGSLGQLACADFPADVRRHTYPPNFRYITQDQIQSTMWQLASLVESLEETLSRPHHDDEGRAKITSILAQMEAAVRTLKGEGVPSNHPLVNANLDTFRLDVIEARRAIQREPPSYLRASAIPSACRYCHAET
jgi:hypothetical protein